MEPPPVQYVTTTDGFNVAYTVAGSGRPFVFMPWPFSHLVLMWRSEWLSPFLEALAARFRLVKYDSRGQGMSTRGLPEYHSMDDYLLDLDAVVDRLGLDRFVLYGGPLFCHAAIRYAAQHPERVEALVLGDASVDHAWSGYQEITNRDWELYLHTIASAFSLHGAPREVAYWRQSLNQEDCLRMFRVAETSSVRETLSLVKAPTLILNTRRLTQDAPEAYLAEEGRAIAALIPDARLVLFDGFGSYLYSEGPEPPAAVLARSSV
jgi:pimeloyl-ACP methyl ester carboxylesterase